MRVILALCFAISILLNPASSHPAIKSNLPIYPSQSVNDKFVTNRNVFVDSGLNPETIYHEKVPSVMETLLLFITLSAMAYANLLPNDGEKYVHSAIARDQVACITTFIGVAIFVKGCKIAARHDILEPQDTKKIILSSVPLYLCCWPLFSDEFAARFFAGAIMVVFIHHLWVTDIVFDEKSEKKENDVEEVETTHNIVFDEKSEKKENDVEEVETTHTFSSPLRLCYWFFFGKDLAERIFAGATIAIFNMRSRAVDKAVIARNEKDQKIGMINTFSATSALCYWYFSPNQLAGRFLAGSIMVVLKIRSSYTVKGKNVVSFINEGDREEAGLSNDISKSGQNNEFMEGSSVYLLSVLICTIIFWRDNLIGIIASSIIACDGAIYLLGRRWGRSHDKAITDSLVFILVSSVASFGLSLWFIFTDSLVYDHQLGRLELFSRIVFICFLSDFVKKIPLINDNISAPLSAFVFSKMFLS